MANDQNTNKIKDRLLTKEPDEKTDIEALEKKVKSFAKFNDSLVVNLNEINDNIQNASKLELVRKKQLKKMVLDDTTAIKKRLEELIIITKKDNSKILQKFLLTTEFFVDSTAKTIDTLLKITKKLSIDGVISVVSKLSKITGRGIGWFLDNTFGRIFKFFGLRGNLLSNLLNKTMSVIYSGIKWVYDIAKTVLVKVWDTFVWLAKIGWNVISTIWDVVATPVKQIYGIFKDVFMAIITSPIGFLGMVVGFTLMIRYAIRTLWPKAKVFIGGLIQGVWDWTLNFVSNLFYKGNTEELMADAKIAKDTVLTWLGDVGKWFLRKYDDFIAPMLNFPNSESIKKYLFGDNNIFKQGWNYLTDITSTLFSDDILDEAQMTWNFLKDIVNRMKYFFGSETEEPEILLYQDAVREENEKRLELFYSDAINAYAKTKLQSELMATILENANTDDKSLSVLLNKSGEEILKNIKTSKFVSDSVLNTKIIDHIDNSMLQSLIKNTISQKSAITQTSVSNAALASKTALTQLSNLNSITSTTDLTEQQEALTAYSRLTIEDFSKSTETLMSKKDIEISANISSLTKSVENNNLIIESTLKNGMVYIEKTAKKLNKKYSDDLQVAVGMYGKSEKELGKILDETFNRDRIILNIFEENAKTSTSMSRKEAEKMADLLLDSLYDVASANANFQKKADGGLVKEPSTVIVGEGNYPELILPISEVGLKFIKESMESVIESANKDSDTTTNKETDKKKSMIKHIRKNLPSQDVKMYDMRNIASGLVVIG